MGLMYSIHASYSENPDSNLNCRWTPRIEASREIPKFQRSKHRNSLIKQATAATTYNLLRHDSH